MSALLPDDGTRVVTKVNLETDYPTRGRRTTTIKVRSSIRAIKSKLVIEVDFPFITVTTEEKLNECIMKNANPDTGFFLNPEDNLYYLVPIEVMQDYFDIRDVCEPSEIEDGYDEETELYYRDGIAYEEGDVVFVGIDEIDRDIPPEKWEPWIANADTLENDILSFFDIKILKKIYCLSCIFCKDNIYFF